MGGVKNMIAQLIAWCVANAGPLQAAGIELTWTEGPPDRPKRSAWVDMSGSAHLVRVTLWDTGECDVQSIELDSGEVRTSHPVIQSEGEVGPVLDDAARAMRSN